MSCLSEAEEIKKHIGIVRYVIQKLAPHKVNDEDVLQIGCIGLLKAIRSFDNSLGDFGTYAYYKVKYEILKDFNRNNAIKVSRKAREILVTIKKEGLTECNIDHIAKQLGVEEKWVRRALDLEKIHVVSVDTEIIHNEKLTYLDMMPVNTDFSHIEIREFLDTLPERDREIIQMRLLGENQRNIGRKLGYSQVHISRLLKRVGVKYMNFCKGGEDIGDRRNVAKYKALCRKK